MSEWVEVENEPVERELLPSLNPLCTELHPEVRDAEIANKISKTKLAKSAPDLDDSEVREMERKRKNKADFRARKKALNEQGTIYSPRRKVIVGKSEPRHIVSTSRFRFKLILLLVCCNQ